MKNDMLSVGLDIGTTKVVVMVGRRKEDSTVEIIGVGQSPSTGVSKLYPPYVRLWRWLKRLRASK